MDIFGLQGVWLLERAESVEAPTVPEAFDDSAAVVVDFQTADDGTLPGQWETYVISTDDAGAKTGAAEADPATYFYVEDGRAMWAYARDPAEPAEAEAFEERGLIA